MHPHLRTPATFIVARLLGIAPHRLSTSNERDERLPRLCGWRLIQRWVQRFDLEDDFQQEDFHGVADHFRDIMRLTMECSLGDWQTYNAPPPLIQLATRLRTQFLIHLTRRGSQQNPVQRKELVAAFPVRLRPLSPTIPPTPARLDLNTC